MEYEVRGGIGLKEYNRIHKWAERHMIKKGKCFYCLTKGRTVWSNIDHKYSQDKTEWQEVCHKCHKAYDTIHLGTPNGKTSPTYTSPKLQARLETYAWYKPN